MVEQPAREKRAKKETTMNPIFADERRKIATVIKFTEDITRLDEKNAKRLQDCASDPQVWDAERIQKFAEEKIISGQLVQLTSYIRSKIVEGPMDLVEALRSTEESAMKRLCRMHSSAIGNAGDGWSRSMWLEAASLAKLIEWAGLVLDGKYDLEGGE